MTAVPDWTLEQGLVKQLPHLGPVLISEDSREGRPRAFAEKRATIWKGR